jgi:hypothetical protein
VAQLRWIRLSFGKSGSTGDGWVSWGRVAQLGMGMAQLKMAQLGMGGSVGDGLFTVGKGVAQLRWIWLSLGRVWLNWGWVAQLGIGGSLGDRDGSVADGDGSVADGNGSVGDGEAQLGMGDSVGDGYGSIGNGGRLSWGWVAHLGMEWLT